MIREHEVKISGRPAYSIAAIVMNLEGVRQPRYPDLPRNVGAMGHLISIVTPDFDAEISILIDVESKVAGQFSRLAQEFHPS